MCVWSVCHNVPHSSVPKTGFKLKEFQPHFLLSTHPHSVLLTLQLAFSIFPISRVEKKKSLFFVSIEKILSFTFLERFFKCFFLVCTAYLSAIAVVLFQTDKTRGARHTPCTADWERSFLFFGVSLYEVKEGHCGRRRIRIYTWSLGHTGNENADMFPWLP